MQGVRAYLQDTSAGEQWQKVGISPHHGIACSLSSLYTENSLGIGDFYDLITLIDWMYAIGMDVIQLLPLNDSGLDISPYSAHSSVALDPVYVAVDQLPGIELFPQIRKKFSALRRYNRYKRVPIHNIKREKLSVLWEYFLACNREIQHTKNYQEFLENHTWVQEYALYQAIKRHQNNAPWYKWQQHLQNMTSDEMFRYIKKYDREIRFFSFLQYIAFVQMRFVKEYATNKQVLLKGDIPISLNRDSADVWFDRDNFHVDHITGSPPDFFQPEGQNWGFPLANWSYMERQDYSWWRRRLHMASYYYHLYRLDHVVGFFRIWTFFQKKSLGFVDENRYLWSFQGRKRLELLLQFSSMLPMAEDLGSIPREVPAILRQLGIAGTKVMRWERYWQQDSAYIASRDYEPISLTTIATHDTESVGEWWEQDAQEATRFAESRGWQYVAPLSFDMRCLLLQDAHRTSSLFHVNPLSEYLQLFETLSFASYKDSRMNYPGKCHKHNWTFRTKTSLEAIADHEKLFAIMQLLCKKEHKEQK
jgi:4-alpha-glucanotransferase